MNKKNKKLINAFITVVEELILALFVSGYGLALFFGTVSLFYLAIENNNSGFGLLAIFSLSLLLNIKTLIYVSFEKDEKKEKRK